MYIYCDGERGRCCCVPWESCSATRLAWARWQNRPTEQRLAASSSADFGRRWIFCQIIFIWFQRRKHRKPLMHQLDGGWLLTTGRYRSAADFPTHLHLAIAWLLHLLHIYRTNCVITKACDHRSRRWNTGLGRPDFEAIFWEWKGEPTTSSGWVQHNFLSETFKVVRKFNWKAFPHHTSPSMVIILESI